MVSRIVISVFLFTVLIAFQNCAKVGGTTQETSAPILVDPPKVTAGNLKDLTVKTNETGEVAFSDDAQEPLDQAKFGGYVLHISSGEVYDDANGELVYTLSADERDKLLSYFKDAKLVSYRRLFEVFPDRLCTMDYNEAYAELISSQHSYVLGEGSSGCPNLDLYDSQYQRRALKLYLSQLSAKIEQASAI